ncbi:hypothetical protein ACFLSF_00315 [Candidatus Bipolaricaulota bacterium]
MSSSRRVPVGVWGIIGFLALCIVVWIIGQGGALVAYDTVAGWGFQDVRETVDPAVVPVNRGIAVGDVAIQLPLFILALVGLWRLRFFGVVAAWMSLSMHGYWTVTAWAKQAFYLQAGIKAEPLAVPLQIMMAVIVLVSLWACWYLYKHRKLFT